MEREANTPEFAAVILGASDFSKAGLNTSLSFKVSALRVRNYLKAQLKIPTSHILSLFDDDRAPSDLLIELAKWLRSTKFSDLVVYYTGHGECFGRNEEYCLLTRYTQKDQYLGTSLHAVGLAEVLDSRAKHARCYLIIDACYAESLVDVWQGTQSEAVKTQLLPQSSRGISVLCAASRRNRARMDGSDGCTMFSGALLHALTQGSPDRPAMMSLREVHADTLTYLETRHKNAVIPALHSPRQVERDIADVRLFPNVSARRVSVLPQLADTRPNRFPIRPLLPFLILIATERTFFYAARGLTGSQLHEAAVTWPTIRTVSKIFTLSACLMPIAGLCIDRYRRHALVFGGGLLACAGILGLIVIGYGVLSVLGWILFAGVATFCKIAIWVGLVTRFRARPRSLVPALCGAYVALNVGAILGGVFAGWAIDRKDYRIMLSVLAILAAATGIGGLLFSVFCDPSGNSPDEKVAPKSLSAAIFRPYIIGIPVSIGIAALFGVGWIAMPLILYGVLIASRLLTGNLRRLWVILAICTFVFFASLNVHTYVSWDLAQSVSLRIGEFELFVKAEGDKIVRRPSWDGTSNSLLNTLGVACLSIVIALAWWNSRLRENTFYTSVLALGTISCGLACAAAMYCLHQHLYSGHVGLFVFVSAQILISVAEVALVPIGYSVIGSIASTENLGFVLGTWMMIATASHLLIGALDPLVMPYSIGLLAIASLGALGLTVLILRQGRHGWITSAFPLRNSSDRVAHAGGRGPGSPDEGS